MTALGNSALAGISFLFSFILGCAGAPYSSVDRVSVAQTYLPLSGATSYSPLHARFALAAGNAEPSPGRTHLSESTPMIYPKSRLPRDTSSTSVPSSRNDTTVKTTTPPSSTTASTIAPPRTTVIATMPHIGPSIHPTHNFSNRPFHRSTTLLHPPTNAVSNMQTNHTPTGIIVGCVLGGVSVIVLSLVALLLCIRRARRRRHMWVQDAGDGITPYYAPEMRQSVRESRRRNGVGRVYRSMGPNVETRSLARTRETYHETRSESDSLGEITLFEEGEDIAAHAPTRSNLKLAVVS